MILTLTELAIIDIALKQYETSNYLTFGTKKQECINHLIEKIQAQIKNRRIQK